MAFTSPNFTAVAAVNPVPVMTTLVPPASGPKFGVKLLMVGAARNVNVPDEMPVPFDRCHADTDRPGASRSDRSDLGVGVHDVAGRIRAPELHGGCAGEVRAGDDDAGATGRRTGRRRKASNGRRGNEVKLPGDTPVPPMVVTLTVTAPAPAGDVAVICVAELTVKVVAAVPPKCTAVAAVKFVPVMTTLVPPAAGPNVGARLVMVGGGTKVNAAG